MKHQYDWSKLDAGWEHNDSSLSEYNGSIVRLEDGAAIIVDALEAWYPGPGEHHSWVNFKTAAQAQLAKCRIEPKPEPSPEYNWSKLEGTGWREGNGAFITNGKFNYWYTLGARPKLESITDKFHGNDALQAELSAEAAVELCRHDAMDEVAEAIDGTGLQLNRVGRGDTIMCIGNALNVDEHRRMWLLSTVRLDIDKLLALSIVIERLKKLGWRES